MNTISANNHRMNRSTRYSCLGFCDIRTVTIRPGRMEDSSVRPNPSETAQRKHNASGIWRSI